MPIINHCQNHTYGKDIKPLHKARWFVSMGQFIAVSIITCVNLGDWTVTTFVKNRSHSKDYLVLISTDISLDDQEIIRLYDNRLSIESFFKTAKQSLKLDSKFQSKNFDAIICSVSIVFIRYMVIEYIRRLNYDFKTVDSLFAEYCDEMCNVDYEYAITILLSILSDFIATISHEFTESLKELMVYWTSLQTSFIKLLISDYCWESRVKNIIKNTFLSFGTLPLSCFLRNILAIYSYHHSYTDLYINISYLFPP